MMKPDCTLEKLTAFIQSKGSALVALSGGVDSTLLSYLTNRALGERSQSVTVVSEFFISHEKAVIDRFVEQYGINHIYMPIHVLEDKRIVSNPSRRCYYCKKAIFEKLTKRAEREGYTAVFDGTNMDDLNEDRPGIRALHELGVVSPFIEAGVGKEGVVRLARTLGLAQFIRPSNTCLATRIPTMVRITEEKLAMVENAETYLHTLGFRVVRVRYHEGDTARIEVAPKELYRLLDTSMHNKILQYFKDVGFMHVTIDIEGYKKGVLGVGPPDGSLNEA